MTLRLVLVAILAGIILACGSTTTTEAAPPTTINYQDSTEMGGATLYRMYDSTTHTYIYMCTIQGQTGAQCAVAVKP